METLTELELMLGDRETFVADSEEKRELLTKWLILKGYTAKDISEMSLADQVSHYVDSEPHVEDEKAPDINEIILDVLKAASSPDFTPDLTRRIARAVIQDEILNGNTLRELVIHHVMTLAPRNVNVTTPAGTVTLNGPQHRDTETIIKMVSIGDNVMMVGPAGCGKTTIGENVARALSMNFYLTSTVGQTHELTGFVDGYGRYHTTPFRTAFQYGGIWLADELDAWDASALLVANAALANGYATFPDVQQPIAVHPNFRVIATANTFGTGADRVYVGRNELDAASLDRFAVVNVDYDEQLERMFSLGNTRWLEHVWNLRKKVYEKKIRHVVSSRAISKGARALANGIAWNIVNESYLFKGMSKSDREKVR